MQREIIDHIKQELYPAKKQQREELEGTEMYYVQPLSHKLRYHCFDHMEIVLGTNFEYLGYPSKRFSFSFNLKLYGFNSSFLNVFVEVFVDQPSIFNLYSILEVRMLQRPLCGRT
mgnify:CR=1 FL=1